MSKLAVLLTVFGLIGGSLAVADAGALAPGLVCLGEEVTVELAAGQLPTAGRDVILGTDGDDIIAAGDGDDVICAGAGNDLVWGQAGADLVSGGEGSDKLRGGDGDDTLYGGPGVDDLNGGRGDDVVMGGADGDSYVRGGTGDDLVDGGPGSDELIAGNGGRDEVHGGDGDDLLVTGGPRPDTLFGGLGNDLVKGHKGADLVFGGEGNDDLRGGGQFDALDGGLGIDTCNGGAQSGAVTACEEALNAQVATPVQDEGLIESHDEGDLVDLSEPEAASNHLTGAVEVAGSVDVSVSDVIVRAGGESVTVPVAADGTYSFELSPSVSGPIDVEVSVLAPGGSTLVEEVTLNVEAPPNDAVLVTPDFARAPDLSGRLIEYNAATGELRFVSGPAGELEPGMVLVGGPSEIAPEGYLRIVEAVTFSGGETVAATRPGGLLDVVRRASVSQTQESLLGGWRDGSGQLVATEGSASVSFAASAVLETELVAEIDWCRGFFCSSGPTLEEFSFEARASASANLDGSADAQVSLGPVDSEFFDTRVATFWIGPVPVTTRVAAEAELSAEFEGHFFAGAGMDFTIGGGFEWKEDGSGRGAYQIGPDRNHFVFAEMTAKSSASATLALPVKFKVADLVGPEVRPRAGLEFMASAGGSLVDGEPTLDWSLDAVLGVDLALDSEVLGIGQDVLPDLDVNLFDSTIRLADGSYPDDESGLPELPEAVVPDTADAPASVAGVWSAERADFGPLDASGENLVCVRAGAPTFRSYVQLASGAFVPVGECRHHTWGIRDLDGGWDREGPEQIAFGSANDAFALVHGYNEPRTLASFSPEGDLRWATGLGGQGGVQAESVTVGGSGLVWFLDAPRNAPELYVFAPGDGQLIATLDLRRTNPRIDQPQFIAPYQDGIVVGEQDGYSWLRVECADECGIRLVEHVRFGDTAPRFGGHLRLSDDVFALVGLAGSDSSTSCFTSLDFAAINLKAASQTGGSAGDWYLCEVNGISYTADGLGGFALVAPFQNGSAEPGLFVARVDEQAEAYDVTTFASPELNWVSVTDVYTAADSAIAFSFNVEECDLEGCEWVAGAGVDRAGQQPAFYDLAIADGTSIQIAPSATEPFGRLRQDDPVGDRATFTQFSVPVSGSFRHALVRRATGAAADCTAAFGASVACS